MRIFWFFLGLPVYLIGQVVSNAYNFGVSRWMDLIEFDFLSKMFQRGCPLDKLAEEYSDFYDEDFVPINCKIEDLERLCRSIPDYYVYFEKDLSGFCYIKSRSLRGAEAKKSDPRVRVTAPGEIKL